jgi:prolipoprotein diacylglyceryltransferase
MYPILLTFPDWLPVVGGRPLFTYGVLLGLAFLVGATLAYRGSVRAGLAEGRVVAVLVAAVVTGLVGARGLFLALHPEDWTGLASLVRVDTGGLTLWGGLLAGAVCAGAIAWALRLDGWALSDQAAPGLALGLAIGHLGCLLFGSDYGRESSSPLAIRFPMWRGDQALALAQHGSPAFVEHLRATASGVSDHVAAQALGLRSLAHSPAGRGSDMLQTAWVAFEAKYEALGAIILGGRSAPVLPSQLLAAAACAVAWLGLLWLRPRARFGGQVVLALALWYAVTRFLLDFTRGDPAPAGVGPLSVSQAISLGIIPVTLAFWWRRSRRPASAAAPR